MITWIEINKKNLYHNLKQFKNLASNSEIWPVIKSNAYGHGFENIVNLLNKNKFVSGFMVVNLDEGIFLKKLTNKPIMVLSYFEKENSYLKDLDNISLPIYDLETAKYLNNLGKNRNKKYIINIKIDTGTSRLGFRVEEAEKVIKELQKKEYLEINSIYTHYAESESENQDFTIKQYKLFKKIVDKFSIKNHSVCSAACISQLQAQSNIVRLGISLYGLWPSEATKKRGEDSNIEIKPVMSWKTKIIQIKELKKGDSIGYDRTYICDKDIKIAILPIGYNEGYDRSLSNKGSVIIRDKKYSIRGNICMNLIMVEIDNKNIKIGDEVILIGSSKNNNISVEDLANNAGTINYEIITRVNSKIKRVII
tara:strand:- start:39 stop:1136 length:1098 start_codon:yes stop_codon:yes gene_type:complete